MSYPAKALGIYPPSMVALDSVPHHCIRAHSFFMYHPNKVTTHPIADMTGLYLFYFRAPHTPEKGAIYALMERR
jgi:hypothetical protein